MPFSFSEIKLIVLGVILLGTAFFSAYVTHQVDNAHLEKLELQYQQAAQKAIQAALAEQQLQEAQALQASKEEATKQKQIADFTNKQLTTLQQHVKDSKCITYGLIRVINSAAKQTTLETLPKDKTDFDCAPVDSIMLSRNIITNYGIANANSQQLNSLIAWLQKLQGNQQQSGKK